MTAKKTKETAAKKPMKRGNDFSLKIKLKAPAKKKETVKKNLSIVKKAVAVKSSIATKPRPKKKPAAKKRAAPKKPRRSSRSSNDADESSESVQGEQSDSSESALRMSVEDVTPISPASSHVSIIPIGALSNSSRSSCSSSSSDEDRPKAKKGQAMGSVAAAVKGRRRSARSKYASPPILMNESTGEELSDSVTELSPPTLITDSSGPSEESDDSANVTHEATHKENRVQKKLVAKTKELVEKPKEEEKQVIEIEEAVEEKPSTIIANKEVEKPNSSLRKTKLEKETPEKIDLDEPVIISEHISRPYSDDELDSKKKNKQRKRKKSRDKAASVETADRKLNEERKGREERKSRKTSKERKESASKERKESTSKERKESASKERKESASKERKVLASKEKKESASKERKESANKERKESANKERKELASKERKESASKERNEVSPSKKKLGRGSKEMDETASFENKIPKKRRRSEKGHKEAEEVAESVKKNQRGEEANEAAEFAVVKEADHVRENNKRKSWDEAITSGAGLANKSPKRAKKVRQEDQVESSKKTPDAKEEKRVDGDKRVLQESKENLQPASKEYTAKRHTSPKRQKVQRFWRSCLPAVLPEKHLLPYEWQSLEKKIMKRYNPKQSNGHIYPIVDEDEPPAANAMTDEHPLRKNTHKREDPVKDDTRKGYSMQEERKPYSERDERLDSHKPFSMKDERADTHKPFSMKDEREDTHKPFFMKDEREDTRKPFSMKDERADTRKPFSMKDEREDTRKPFSVKDEREDTRKPFPTRDERTDMHQTFPLRDEREDTHNFFPMKDDRGDKHNLISMRDEREGTYKPLSMRDEAESTYKPLSTRGEREDTHKPLSMRGEKEDTHKPLSMRGEREHTHKPLSMRDEREDTHKHFSMRDEREDIREPYFVREEREDSHQAFLPREDQHKPFLMRNEKEGKHKTYPVRNEAEDRFKSYSFSDEDPFKSYSMRDEKEDKNKPYPMRDEGMHRASYPEPSYTDRNLKWQEAMRRLQQDRLEVPVFPSDIPKKAENSDTESGDRSQKDPPRFRTYSPAKGEIKSEKPKKADVKSREFIEETLGKKSNKSVAYFLSIMSEGKNDKTDEEAKEQDGWNIPTHEIPLPPSRDPRSQSRNTWSTQQQPQTDSEMYESVALPGQPAPPNYEQIDENIYYVERKKSKQSKEVRRMQCDCTIADECGEDCLNRLLMIECGSTCPVGVEKCLNRQFTKRMYSKCEPFSTEMKGRGLAASEDIPAGSFVMEYVGEVIDGREFNRRVKYYGQSSTVHTYFMALKGDWIVDATRKGNASRFINHSCDPNAETQKWTVNGDLRVGFFSRKFIPAGEEITFDYQFQNYGREPQKCFCGSTKCRGWLSKPADQLPEQEDEEEEAVTKGRKKKIKDENDMDVGKELAKLEVSGIRNRTHTLTVARIMIRAESLHNRKRLLHLLLNADEPCKRLFLDYHGLALLWTWMVDHSTSLRLEILRLLEMLPIPDKTMLNNSKVLSVVEKWVQLPASVPSTPSSTESDHHRAGSDDSESSSKDEDSMNQEQEAGVAYLANKLIDNWSSLSELFKIPKTSDKLVNRKQHELEADRGYRERHHENVKDKLKYGIMPKRSEEEKSRLKRNNWDRVWDIPRLEEQRKEVEQRANSNKEQESLEERFEKAQNVWEDHKDNCLSLGLEPQKTPIYSRDLTQVFNLATAEWVDIPEEYCEQLQALENPYCIPPTLSVLMHHPQAIVGNPTVISPDRLPLLPPTIIISPEGLTTATSQPAKQRKPKKNNTWKKAKDPKGREYYYNIVTRKSQWVPPEEWGEDDDDDDDDSSDSSEDNSEETSTEDSEEDSDSDDEQKKTTSLVQEHIISPRNEDSSDEYREISRKIRKAKEKSLKAKIMIQQQQQQQQAAAAARKQRPDAAYDPSEDLSDIESSGGSDYEGKIKEKFKASVADVIVRALNPYRRHDRVQGRITSNEDFKHLAKKLTHFVMLKELKQIRSVDDLHCSESVKHKAKEFVKKYMNKYPGDFTKQDSFL